MSDCKKDKDYQRMSEESKDELFFALSQVK
jgi:hypothetical protein|nr:MAG TPA: hypothetical protein [Caudoviricetes sp.]